MTEHYDCELCNFSTNSAESFSEHLRKHSKSELLKLYQLTKLSIEDPEKYEELMWEMLKLECESSNRRRNH